VNFLTTNAHISIENKYAIHSRIEKALQAYLPNCCMENGEHSKIRKKVRPRYGHRGRAYLVVPVMNARNCVMKGIFNSLSCWQFGNFLVDIRLLLI